jgi:phosphoglycerate dehydrogenase-like enzyme
MPPDSSRLRIVAQGKSIGDLLRSTLPKDVDLVVSASTSDEEVARLLADADVSVGNRFSQGMATHARRLRLIQTTGIGTDGIDLDAVPPMTTVCNVVGHEAGVTEYAFMVMLALQNDLIGMDRRLRAGDWADRTAPPRQDLRGRTLAIIGLGRIGTQMARIASAFEMRVVAIARRPDPERARSLGIEFVGTLADLHDVLRQADIVVLAVPLTERTAGLIGKAELRAMKSSAYLVNIARGAVVDEAALYQALSERTIAGAAIDVWYRYPTGAERAQPSEFPFHDLDNVVMTPHIAGWSEGTMRARMSQIAENLRRLAAGEPLANVIAPA